MIPNVLPDLTVPVADIEKQFDAIAGRVRGVVEDVTREGVVPSWDTVVEPLNAVFDEVHMFANAVSHRNAVARTEELNIAATNMSQKLSNLSVDVSQNELLFDAYVSITKGKDYENLSAAQKKSVENYIRDAKLGGLGLSPDDKSKFKELQARLSKLGNDFQNNVVLAKDGWHKHVTEKEDLRGIPEKDLDNAKEAAKERNLSGWVFTLDLPVYMSVMQYADNRSLRKEMYGAFSTRSSDQGPNAGKWDNFPIMQEKLAASHEAARILGFHNAAEWSLATKAAESTKQVVDFLMDLVQKTKPKAEREYAKLREVAAADGVEDFSAWDTAYYLEKWKQGEYAFSDSDVKEYFPESKVLEGMFHILGKLYGIKFEEQKDVSVWHESVKFYSVLDVHGELIAGVYIDLYARPGKRGGAWMDEPVIRRKTDHGVQLPVAYLECNFARGSGGEEAYLTHYDVETLFHECGHTLHHMLTKVDCPDVSGINGVEWDAVELPSQFFEHWTWDKEILMQLLTKHRDTGDSIPAELVDKMIAAKNYDAGLAAARQLEFALFDFLMYMEYEGGSETYIADQLAKAREIAAVVQYPKTNRFQNAFAHIFGGGYAAGYYSYKWAEVMAADAFEPFREKGLLSREQGEKFRDEILARGGSRSAMDNFIAYRGRAPQPEALLRRDGFIEDSE